MTTKTLKTIRAYDLKVGDTLDVNEVVESVISEPTEDGWVVSITTADDFYFYYESDEVDILV